MALKNVSLLEKQVNGLKSWQLLNSNGEPIKSFDLYGNLLDIITLNNTQIAVTKQQLNYYIQQIISPDLVSLYRF